MQNTYEETGGLKYTGDFVVQVQTHLLTSNSGSSTWGERQFIKVFRNHTMLTTSFNGQNPTLCPNGRNSTIVFHGPTSKSQLPGWTQLLNIMVGTELFNTIIWTQLQLSAIEADNPAVCRHCPKSTPNWLFFKIFKFSGPLLPGMMSFTLQPSSPIWGLLWQLWLSYPLCMSIKLYQCLCTWTKSRIVQSPTKLNYKI